MFRVAVPCNSGEAGLCITYIYIYFFFKSWCFNNTTAPIIGKYQMAKYSVL